MINKRVIVLISILTNLVNSVYIFCPNADCFDLEVT